MDPDMDMGGMDHGHGGMDMGGAGSNGFCTGTGSVMNNGFVFLKEESPCLLYLFQGAVVDSPGKYAGAIIGTFLLAFLTEGFRHLRVWMRVRRAKETAAKQQQQKQANGGGGVGGLVGPLLLEAVLFGVHMLLSYLIMLLVMLYEWAIFLALLFGLGAGYFAFELWETIRVANGNKPQAVLVGGVGGGCGCVGDIVMAVPTTKEEEEGEDPRNPPVV